MKVFTFRLAAVLRVRGVEAAIAHGRVAEAARALSRAVARELEIKESYRRWSHPEADLDGATFLASFEHGARFAEMVAEASRSRAVLEARLLKVQREAADAERRVAMIDRLYGRRREEWLAELQREDAAELDEFSARRATRAAMAARHVD